VRFQFVPDKLGVEPDLTATLEDGNAHVRPPLRLPAPRALFPYTAHA